MHGQTANQTLVACEGAMESMERERRGGETYKNTHIVHHKEGGMTCDLIDG